MFKIRNLWVGFLNVLISFPAIVVVTSILGFNMANAFLFAGIGTLIFHLITKNKLPIVLGVSGSYIAVMLSIAGTVGPQYITGGVICYGLVYIFFGLIGLKWQQKLLSFFPNWLMSMAIVLIGLSLLPIGQGLATQNLLVGFVTLFVAIFCSFSKNPYLNMGSMMLGLLAGTGVYIAMNGIPVAASIGAAPVLKFAVYWNLNACIQMTLLTIVVFSEMMGDTNNTGDIIGFNVFEKVGVGAIAIASGITQMVAGAFGNNAYTTYSENIGALLILKHFDPWAQVWTAIIFILMSFIPVIFTTVAYIPMSAFGGILLFLYGIVTLNAIKQIHNSVDLNVDFRVLVILSAMLSASFVPITLFGLTLSGASSALAIGMILNKLTERKA